jgi:benzoylformate decarboxylase
VALTPPTGPVFLALPLDVQSARAEGLDLSPPHVPDRRTRPPLAALQKAAAVLAGARAPVILAGSRVAEAGAFRELAAVAERLGAPVFSEAATSHGRLPLATDHPLYAGPLPLWSPQVRDRLAGHDVILAVGLNLLRLYIHQEPERPLPDDARLIHLDNVPWEVGKNYPVEIGLVGDPQSGLAELDALLAARPGPPPSAAARERLQRHATARRAEQAALRSAIDRQDRDRPMPPLALMGALVRAMPANALVVEEAVTTHQNVLERLGALKDPAAWFAHRGWALGWGLGCALGVKLARPDRPVLGLIGDGATMYGLQALWTAAHHRIGAVFVICNNAQYKILKDCAALLPLPEMARGNHLAMDLVRPAIDFVGLARSLGVEAHRVEGPDEAAERVRAGLQGDRPLVLEAVLGA